MSKYFCFIGVLFICFYFYSAFSMEEDVIKTKVHSIHKTKQQILSVAKKESATSEEKALLLAVASIETEDFSNNFPVGDNKSGDAYNVSLYKMNVGMIKDIDPAINPSELQNNMKLATQVMLKGVRKFGVNKFLTYHRGGAGAFDGKIPGKDIKPYVDAVKKIAEKYLEDPKQLSPDTTDDTRYTIVVPAI